MTDKKDLMNEAYDALLITTGVVGLSFATKKLFKEKLTDATSTSDILKLTAGITASTLLVKYVQDKKWVPSDPFKGK